jgi:ATP-dependent Clp protease ATP-binding subunit ClpB
MDKVRKHFQPEFLNRIDEFILFEPLVAEQIETIVRMRTRGVGTRLAEKKMRLELRDAAIKHLATVGFDPVYGARPVKRAVQREMETPLAKALLSGLFQVGEGGGGYTSHNQSQIIGTLWFRNRAQCQLVFQ